MQRLWILLLAILLLDGLALAPSVAAEERPNIVFAFADDWGRHASVYADIDPISACPSFSTPNFDRVAREGALFDCALVSAPSCTPSRAAIVAGRRFFRNGSHSQLHHPWVKGFPDPWDEVRGFPLMLQGAGYSIGWSYKMHISEDRMGGRKRNFRQAGSRFNSFSQNAMRADDPQREKERLLDEVRQNFKAFLSSGKPDQPYFYWFNPTNTHRAWVRGSGKALWGVNPDDLKGRLPKFLPDNSTVREDFADFLGEAMAFDAAVGVLREVLQERGELDNTILVVSGDHGAPGFPRGKCNLYDFGTQVPLAIRWPEHIAAGNRIASPVSLIDLAPTYLEACGLEMAEDMDGESLLPVMRPNGRASEEILRGYAIVGRENHVRDARPGGLPYPMRGIRTADFLYIVNFAPDRWPVAQPPLAAPLVKGMRKKQGKLVRPMDIDFGPTRDFFTSNEGNPSIQNEWELGFDKRPGEELYHVGSDPDQLHNLVNDPKFSKVRADLRERLFDELTEGNDPRVTGEGDAFDHPPYAPDDPLRGVIEQPITPSVVPTPLFADPHYHGSCDPEVVWNSHEQEWWVFYTARRAEREKGTYVGTPIGVAASEDGRDWRFVGYCSFDGVPGQPDNADTRWAPGLIRTGDTYHMFVTYKDNAQPPWGGQGQIVHYAAPASNLLTGWQTQDAPSLAQPDPIDATLIQVGDNYRAYYRVGKNGGIQWSESADLKSWTNHGKCPGEVNKKKVHGLRYQEAPFVFRFADAYWMLTDPHKGLAVYRSEDAVTWRFHGRILQEPGTRPQDHTLARHPSVAVVGDRALLFYHVEPNQPYPTPPAEQRTTQQKLSYLQMAELRMSEGTLICDRNLPTPANFLRTASPE